MPNINIFLIELTHNYAAVDAKNSPLAIGYIGSYLLNQHKDVSVECFKYPEDLSSKSKSVCPNIVGFSNYMWNEELSYYFAKRIKKIYPDSII